jgi:hypothetical protein
MPSQAAATQVFDNSQLAVVAQARPSEVQHTARRLDAGRVAACFNTWRSLTSAARLPSTHFT